MGFISEWSLRPHCRWYVTHRMCTSSTAPFWKWLLQRVSSHKFLHNFYHLSRGEVYSLTPHKNGSDFMNKSSGSGIAWLPRLGSKRWYGFCLFSFPLSKCLSLELSHHVVRKLSHIVRPPVAVLAHNPSQGLNHQSSSTTNQQQLPDMRMSTFRWCLS